MVAVLTIATPNFPNVVVSSVSANGIPIGNDTTGLGTAASPFLTGAQAAKCIASTATVQFNGTAGSPPTYTWPNTITTNLTLKSAVAGSKAAVLTGTNTTAALLIAPASGQTVALQDLIVDPSLATGGAAASVLQLATQATLYTVTASNCALQNWTTDGITTTATAGNKVNLTLDATTSMIADGVKSAVRLLGHTAGAVSINGTVTITNQSQPYWPVIYALADAAGPTAALNCTMNVGVDSSLAGANSHFGAVLSNYQAATINGSYTMTTAAASRQCYVVGLAVGDIAGGGYPALAIDNSVLSGTVVHNAPAGGLGAFLNPDSYPIDATKANNVIIDSMTATGNGSAHGLFACQCTDPIIRNSTSTGFALGGAIKLCVRGEVHHVTGSNSSSSIWQWKGGSGTGSQHDNTWTQTAGFTGTMLTAQQAPENSTYPTFTVANDTFNIAGAAGPQFVGINTGATVTISSTAFVLNSGSASAHPWADQGVNYDTTAAMKAHFGSTNTSNLP